MNPADPDPLSVLATKAKTCDEAKVQLADRSAEMLMRLTTKDSGGFFVESEDVLGNYFVVRFQDDVAKYDIAKGMSWRSFLFSSFRFSRLDFFRRRESSPACHYHRRNGSTRVTAVSTEVAVSTHRYDHPTTIGDNLVNHRSDDRSDQDRKTDFFACIKSISDTRTRLVLLLLYVEDLTMRETGERLGFSESWVCNTHRAGLEKLAKDLGQSP